MSLDSLIPLQYICRARAMFDFGAEEEGEISFRKGDILIVTEKPDPNWWVGFIDGDTVQGHFPSTYVEVLRH